MNIEKEVDSFLENIKLIDKYTNEVKNNSELIQKIAAESVEISKIKEELNHSINAMNSISWESRKIIENALNKNEQSVNNVQQHLNMILQKNLEQNKIINNNINSLASQIINLTKIFKIGLGILIFLIILLIILLLIR